MKSIDERLRIDKVLPEAYKVLAAVDGFIRRSGISAIQQEIIKIRASQINGCAYCVDAHAKEARRHGESEQRIYVLSVWREAPNLFSDEEQLLLEITEEVSLIHERGLSDHLYQRALTTWGEEHTAYVLLAIIHINSWNRIGVATRRHPSKS